MEGDGGWVWRGGVGVFVCGMLGVEGAKGLGQMAGAGGLDRRPEGSGRDFASTLSGPQKPPPCAVYLTYLENLR